MIDYIELYKVQNYINEEFLYLKEEYDTREGHDEVIKNYMKIWEKNKMMLLAIFEENFDENDCPSWADFKLFREDIILKMLLRLIDFQEYASGNDKISFWNELACPFVSGKVDICAGTTPDELKENVGSYPYREFNFN